MTDRKLLELAAKAAGITYRLDRGVIVEVFADGHAEWNPLTDDGDALRLAVKLGLSVSHGVHSEHVFCDAKGASKVNDYGTDPYAATRRAIVRAAAEIGAKS
jgi:hypothetical protein